MNLASYIRQGNFRDTLNGTPVNIFYLKKGRMSVAITNYGARIVALLTPDKNGTLNDIVRGFDNLRSYRVNADPYVGATIGRYANRIAQSRFQLEGKSYKLTPNEGSNSLHGGEGGFHSKAWKVLGVSDEHIRMQYLSVNGEEGFPGNLTVEVLYHLEDPNTLSIEYSGRTDRATPVNLTNHNYFNLGGIKNGSALDHIFTFYALKVYHTDSFKIPIPELQEVYGTPFDFGLPKALKEAINEPHPQITAAGGFDHCYAIAGYSPGKMFLAADVVEPVSGRKMSVLSSQPGFQFYTSNNLQGMEIGKMGGRYKKHSSFCIEPQRFPNSPNQALFPSSIIYPNEEYSSRTLFKFSIKE